MAMTFDMRPLPIGPSSSTWLEVVASSSSLFGPPQISSSIFYSPQHLSSFVQSPSLFANSSTLLSSNSATSVRGSFQILGCHPLQGEPGTTVTVSLRLSTKPADAIFLRLVIGRKALSTSVRQLSERSYGGWELQSTVPHDVQVSSQVVVPLSVQVLDSANQVLDSVTFGDFTYLPSASGSRRPAPIKHEAAEDEMSASVPPVMHRSASLTGSPLRATASVPSHSPSRVAHSSSGRLRESKRGASGRHHKKHPGQGRRLCFSDNARASERAHLELLTPLESMSKDWEDEEVRNGRRLVRFDRVQDGFTIRVSCERISIRDYTEGDVVVSCIYRAETDQCLVTSVDIIYLLENLIGEEFDIEEKNRIRRNLEGFRPQTVSKNRMESNDFFAQIMNFPPPKPRNIEKDLKVFDWKVLPQALEKIISRYSLSVSLSEQTDRRRSSAPEQRTWSPISSSSSSSPLPEAILPRSQGDYKLSQSRESSSYLQRPDPFEPFEAPCSSASQDELLLPLNDAAGLYAGSQRSSPSMFSSPSYSPPLSYDPGCKSSIILDPQSGAHQGVVVLSDALSLSESMYSLEGFMLNDTASLDSVDFHAPHE